PSGAGGRGAGPGGVGGGGGGKGIPPRRGGPRGGRGQRRVPAGERGQPPPQIALLDGRELVDAGRRQKTLEAADARRGEILELVPVARHDATPEQHFHAADRRRPAFRLKPLHRRRRRKAVERHVDGGRDAAGRRGGGGGGEAFPLGAAGLVHVDVRVDEAGRDEEVADVRGPGSGARGARVDRADRGDLIAGDFDLGRLDAVGKKDPGRADYH